MQARQQAQAVLREPAFTRLILDIGRNLLTPPGDVRPQHAKAWVEKILDQRWRKLSKCCRDFTKLNPAERHRTRIAAKKMRYVADACASLYGNKRTERFIAVLAALQDELGYTNDLMIGQQLLRRLPKRSGALGFAFGSIHGVLVCKAGQQADLSGDNWKRLMRVKLFWR